MKIARKPVWNESLRLRAKHRARRRLLEVLGEFHQQTNATMERAQAAAERLLASQQERLRMRCSDLDNGPCDYMGQRVCWRCGNPPPT